MAKNWWFSKFNASYLPKDQTKCLKAQLPDIANTINYLILGRFLVAVCLWKFLIWMKWRRKESSATKSRISWKIWYLPALNKIWFHRQEAPITNLGKYYLSWIIQLRKYETALQNTYLQIIEYKSSLFSWSKKRSSNRKLFMQDSLISLKRASV